MHSEGIAHKDLNVRNILINPETKDIKFIDFGLSQIFSNSEEQFFISMEGSLGFRPPFEVCEDWRSGDLWSAFLIYHSLRGNESFTTKQLLKYLNLQNDENHSKKFEEFCEKLAKQEDHERLYYRDFHMNI